MNSERVGDICVTSRRRLKQGRIKQAFQHYLATQYQLDLTSSSRPKTFDSTLNESRIKRRRSRDNDEDDVSKFHLRDDSEDNYFGEKHRNIRRDSKKRKISNLRMSEILLSANEDRNVYDQICVREPQCSFSDHHHQHHHRHHRDHHHHHHQHCHHDHHHHHHHHNRRRYLSNMNCYYLEEENNREAKHRRVSLKSMTFTAENDDGKIRKRSLTSELGNDDLGIEYQEIHYIKPSPVKRCSSKTNFFRRCSSIISFGKSSSKVDLTKNNNEINKNQNIFNANQTYKRVDKDATQHVSTNQRNSEISVKLDRIRTSLANDCLAKFGKHCIPLMKILNKDNICNQSLDNVLTPSDHNELKQPNFLKCLLLSHHLTNITSGLYVTCLLHSSGKVLVTSHSLLPTVKVDLDEVTDMENHFYWLMKATSDWSLMKNLKQVMKKELANSKKSETSFSGKSSLFLTRYAILKAVNILQKLTGIEKLGNLHTNIVSGNDYNVFLFINTDTHNETKSTSSPTISTSPSSISSSMSLAWISLNKLSSFSSQSKHLPSSPSPNKKCKPNGILKELTGNSEKLLTEARRLYEKLEDGIHISYLALTCHLQTGLSILVSKQQPNAFPSIKLEDPNLDVNTTTDRYANILGKIKNTDVSIIDEGLREMMTSKIFQLLDIVKTALPATPEPSPSSSSLSFEPILETPPADACRLHTSIFPLDEKISLIILSPPPCLVCPLINYPVVSPSSFCFFVPIRTFEMIQLVTYQPQIYRKYCHLSVILEIATEICKQRKVISENDYKRSPEYSTDEINSISSSLSELKREVDETWMKYRWLGDVITQARLPSSENFISLQHLI